MQNQNFKKIGCAVLAAISIAAFCTGCQDDKKYEPVATATPEPTPDPLYVLPEDCTLTEEVMQETLDNYASYMADAINEENMTFTCRVDDDGTVHYDAVAEKGRNLDTISDVKEFDSVTDAFAYLYNNGQIDIDGNILVRAVEDVKTEMNDVGESAESEATSYIEQAESNANAE